MEKIRDDVIRVINLSKRELLGKIQSAYNTDDIETRIFLYKKYESLNLFQELFFIACNNNCNQKEGPYCNFKRITKGLVDSCKAQQIIDKSSWATIVKVYSNVDEIIRKVTYGI